VFGMKKKFVQMFFYLRTGPLFIHVSSVDNNSIFSNQNA